MVTHDCDTCEGTGEVLTMVPGFTGEPVEGEIDCPDCDGNGSFQTPTRFERVMGVDRVSAARRRTSRIATRIDWARARWAERNATSVAASAYAHRQIIEDEPRLREMIEHDLIPRLAVVTPLRWRQDDLRWCWANAKRALRGEEMLPPPFEEVLNVRSEIEGAPTLFERGMILIIAERARRPAREVVDDAR